jgi:hypothetical protein
MNEKAKFGSTEYHLEKAVESIEQAKKTLIGDLSTIGKGQPLLKYETWLKNFSEYKVGYGSFDPKNKGHVESAYEQGLKAIDKALENIELVKARNEEIIESNKKIREHLLNLFREIGIESSYSKWEKPPRKRNSEWVRYPSGYFQDFDRYLPTADSYTSYKNLILERKRIFEEARRKYLADIQKDEKEKQAKEKELLLAAKALNFAEKHGITLPEGEELVDYVSRVAQTLWENENYPVGTQMSGGCQDCDTWTVGDHRCECGNRRIELEIEGDFLEGFIARAQAY